MFIIFTSIWTSVDEFLGMGFQNGQLIVRDSCILFDYSKVTNFIDQGIIFLFQYKILDIKKRSERMASSSLDLENVVAAFVIAGKARADILERAALNMIVR